MARVVVYMALMAGAALALTGCGFTDSRSPVPDFMRAKASEPPPPEPAPDVKQMIRKNLDAVFIATSYPRNVQVSPPRRDPRGGPGWLSCVKAELTSATGKPLGIQTYQVTISGGVILDRRRTGPEDVCSFEPYEPI
jgi:hypothetical protein